MSKKAAAALRLEMEVDGNNGVVVGVIKPDSGAEVSQVLRMKRMSLLETLGLSCCTSDVFISEFDVAIAGLVCSLPSAMSPGCGPLG